LTQLALGIDRGSEVLAPAPTCELHVVNVVRIYGGNPYLELEGMLVVTSLDEASARLSRHVEQKLDRYSAQRTNVRAPLFEHVVTHLGIDSPAEEIARLASVLNADLVVIGSHGHRGLRHALLGSVAERIVRLSPAPVLIVRPMQVEIESVQQAIV
jgi:nucleotide-binding universal stress UspA family protein